MSSNPLSGLAGRCVSIIFVVFWASGFIVARTIRPYAEPFTFVSARFALAALVMALIALIGRAAWPGTQRGWLNNLVAGALLQGLYVGPTFWAVKHGLPPAVAALISGLQPLLTAAISAPLLGEHVGLRRWGGIVTGFVGALLVLAPNVLNLKEAPPVMSLLAGLVAMLSITFGTIWQKRTGGSVDLRSGSAIQLLGGFLAAMPFAAASESGTLPMIAPVLLSLAYAVIVLNALVGSLLLWLIRRGAVASVTSLFYLSPPVTALMAFVLFGDKLVPIQIFGMAVAAVGVAFASR